MCRGWKPLAEKFGKCFPSLLDYLLETNPEIIPLVTCRDTKCRYSHYYTPLQKTINQNSVSLSSSKCTTPTLIGLASSGTDPYQGLSLRELEVRTNFEIESG